MLSPISGFGLQNFSLNLSVRPKRTGGTGSTAFSGGEFGNLRNLARTVVDLRGRLQALSGHTGVRTLRTVGAGGSGTTGAATSASSLGLNLVGTATTLQSTEEVNTTPTSFTPFAPTVTGSTTTQPTIGGVYDGAQGDDTLTFVFKDTGTIGTDKIKIEVYDGNDEKIDDFEYKRNTSLITLSNGLTLNLSAGDVTDSDTFTVDVSTSVGSAVDPDKPLDGTLNNNPNLELGDSITPGAFFINGAQIDIVSGDTLNDVLAKISASAADVTAVFNSTTEEVELTHKTDGANSITLGSDATGFFAATKLTGATEVLGADNELNTALSQVGALSGISNGNFSVNGVSFTVDTSTDSLTDIIDQINASSADVTASYDTATGKFNLIANNAGDELTISDGTSNFFAGVDITEGTFGGGESGSGTTSVANKFTAAAKLPALFEEFSKSLNQLFSTSFDDTAGGPAQAATDRLQQAITDVFERVFDQTDGDRLRTPLGIGFFFDEPDKGVLRIDKTRLDSATSSRQSLLADFLTTDDGSKQGLLPALDKALEEIGASLIGDLDPVASRGLIIDLRA